jgi:hypothetical protein
MQAKFRTIFVTAISTLVLFGTITAEATSRHPVRGNNGVVASSSAIASKVGVEILKKGGNAVDAAVATAFAMAVTWPTAGNIGGGGFLIYHGVDGETAAFDFREKAPLAATKTMYLDEDGNVRDNSNHDGILAVGVPGTVAGLELAQQIGSGEIPPPDRLYIATGTMGSAAGLALGLALAGLHCRIEAIRVSMTSICNERKLARMIANTAMMMRRIDPSIPQDLAQRTNIRLRDDFYAGGYAHSDAATDQAAEFGRDRLDLVLEKTYTAKALAALLHDLPDAGDEHLLFWNTYNSATLKRNSPERVARESLPPEFLRYLGS